MYAWRNMTKEQKKEALKIRQRMGHPLHGPPHQISDHTLYHVTAACYEHKPIIGKSAERMAEFERDLLEVFSKHSEQLLAWCVLPNHYHVLADSLNIMDVIKEIGRLHGRTSFYWNTEENRRGRKCWHRCVERAMRTERHKWVTLNYIHHNPVHHKYVTTWQGWPFSSAKEYLEGISSETAEQRWKAYPLLDYGRGWDDPDI